MACMSPYIGQTQHEMDGNINKTLGVSQLNVATHNIPWESDMGSKIF